MSDTPEPLAAILAEMRGNEFDDPNLDADGIIGARRLARDWADRIEAAAERKRENTIYAGRDGEMTLDECITRCDNNSDDTPRGRDVEQIGGWLRELRERRHAPGNAAAMREALHKISNLIWSSIDPTCNDDCCKPKRELARLADAALTAPTRNCDRFKTLDEAREAFQDLRGHKILADVELWDSMDEAGALVRWLFAPAQGGKE